MLAIALLFAVVPAEADPPFSADGIVLCDFDDAASLAQWSPRDLTTLELTDDWSSGGSAAAITYHEWSEGEQQWPAIIIRVADGGMVATDFSPYDALEWDAYNPGDEPAYVALHLTDGDKQFVERINIEPKSELHISVPVRKIAAALDASAVRELHFYVSRPERTYTWYIDDLRLSLDLLPSVEELAASVVSLDRDVAEIDAPQLARHVRRIGSLRADAEALAASVDDAEFNTYDEVLAVREQLARLEARYISLGAVRPALRALKSLKGREDASFALATESAMTKVFLEGGRFESEFAKQHRLSAARNERESFQVIVFPLSDDVADVTWEIEPPRNATGDEVGASARVVGYVDCMQPSYPVDHNGWWPDPLLEYADSIDEVPFGEVLPLWVSIDVPADAKPGTYRGKVTVNAGGESQSVAIRLRVWDFELPNNTHLRTALSLRGFREGIWPGLGPEETRSGYEDWMQGYYLNPGDIYSGPPKWSAERIRELVDGGMNAINLGYFGAAREPDFDEAAYWRSYEALAAKIEDYMPTIEEAGARDLCYIYCFDERPQDQLDVVFETANKLSERFPGIAIMTTAYDANFGLSRDDADAMDIWVPLTPKFDTLAPRIADARAAGRDIWWYICIGPKHPHANWFIEYPAIEHRLIMGMMTAKYEPGGFLYYAVNRWPVNPTPCAGAPRTDWNPASYRNNNGDGSIMVAGPDGPMATLRLENIRDGIEDYEYYLLLRELIDERGAPEALGEVTKDVVADLTHFTYDPDVLSKERERVAREILALRRR